jgi:hypothetical protein
MQPSVLLVHADEGDKGESTASKPAVKRNKNDIDFSFRFESDLSLVFGA